MNAPRARLAAVVLAGGRAARMGGVRKPLLEVGGRSLLRIAVDAARAHGDEVIVVGPEWARSDGAMLVSERPSFGGPVAALAAALSETTADEVLVLAADLPRADDAAAILAGAERGADGVCLSDEGRRQWLTAVYRSDGLRQRMEGLDGVEGASMRALTRGLELAEVPGRGASADVDTWEALARVRGDGARIGP